MSTSSYIKETIIAGDVIEERKYFAARRPGAKILRGRNEKITTDEQWVVNERMSIKNLYYKILVNFKKDDIRMDLTHKGIEPDKKTAKKFLSKFMRNLRDLYKKRGKVLKWIATTECDGHRIHHHLLVNNIGLARSDYNHLWPHAELNYKSFRYYDGQPEDAERLSKYLVKETRETFCKEDAIQKRRWTSSRNLKNPIIKKEIIHCKSWTEKPRPKKGYYVQTVKSGYTAFGYPFQWYRMIREDDRGETNKTKRRTIPGKKKAG